jgi:hypothetical protein
VNIDTATADVLILGETVSVPMTLVYISENTMFLTFAQITPSESNILDMINH